MNHVGVGVAVIIQNEYNEYLLGLRKGDHCPNTWSFPGGKIEKGETPYQAASREVFEEANLVISPRDFLRKAHLPYVNTFFESGDQWITLLLVAGKYAGVPIIKEPDKCAEWRWCSLDNLPLPLFRPLAENVQALFFWRYQKLLG